MQSAHIVLKGCALCITLVMRKDRKYTPFERALIQLGRGARLTRIFYWQTHRTQYLFDDATKVSGGVFESLERQNAIERSAMPVLNARQNYTALEYKISPSGAQRAAALIEQHERHQKGARP